MSFFDSGPLPDWKDIQKWLGKDMPWDLVEQWEKKDGSWLDNYIKNLIPKEDGEAQSKTKKSNTDSVPKPTVRTEAESSVRTSRVQTDVIKDKTHLTVNVRMPSGNDLGSLRIYATPDRLKLINLPGGQDQILRLPCLIMPKTGRALWKQDKLTIRFKRRPANHGEVELFIRS